MINYFNLYQNYLIYIKYRIYDLLNLFGGFVGKCNYMISFSNFKCTPPLSELFFSTNYIVRPCAFASYIVYLLLWLKIKEELRKAVNDEQKKRNLEQGKCFILFHSCTQTLLHTRYATYTRIGKPWIR